MNIDEQLGMEVENENEDFNDQFYGEHFTFPEMVDQFTQHIGNFQMETFDYILGKCHKILNDEANGELVVFDSDLVSERYTHRLAEFLEEVLPNGIEVKAQDGYNDHCNGKIALLINKQFWGDNFPHVYFGNYNIDTVFNGICKDLNTLKNNVYPEMRSTLPELDGDYKKFKKWQVSASLEDHNYCRFIKGFFIMCLPDRFHVMVKNIENPGDVHQPMFEITLVTFQLFKEKLMKQN